jgi:hypothetical protein
MKRLFLPILILAVLLGTQSNAATPTPAAVFAQTVIVGVGQSTNGTPGTSGSPITVVDCTASQATTPGYDCSGLGAKINSLLVVSTDTASRTVSCAILNNSVNYMLFVKVTVIASATASQSFSGLASNTVTGPAIDEGTNPYVYLTTKDKLVCWASAVTAATTINYIAFGGSF